MGYLVPFLPESARVVRLSGNLQLNPDTLLGRRALELITHHEGPVRSLAPPSLNDSDRSQLARFGLALDEADCVRFSSQTDQFVSCSVKRESEPPGPR